MDPRYVTYKGKRYDLNTDYRVALKALKLVNDQQVSGLEKVFGVIYLLFGDVPLETTEDIEFFYEKAKKFLQCGADEEEHEQRKRDLDFEADSGYIEASFQSDYGIDLSSCPGMHWWRFYRLICGLTEHTILARIRTIRNYDLNTIKDEKEKQRMREMQRAVALPEEPLTAEEQALDDAFEALFENNTK